MPIVNIGQTFAEIWQFIVFSRWRPSAITDLWGTNLDLSRRLDGF